MWLVVRQSIRKFLYTLSSMARYFRNLGMLAWLLLLALVGVDRLRCDVNGQSWFSSKEGKGGASEVWK